MPGCEFAPPLTPVPPSSSVQWDRDRAGSELVVRTMHEPAQVTYGRTPLSPVCQMPLSRSPSPPPGPQGTQGCGIPERPSPPGSQAPGEKESLPKGGKQERICCITQRRALHGNWFPGVQALTSFPARSPDTLRSFASSQTALQRPADECHPIS